MTADSTILLGLPTIVHDSLVVKGIARADTFFGVFSGNIIEAGNCIHWVLDPAGRPIIYTGDFSGACTYDALGISKGGCDNKLWGSEDWTHINLGVACTTGADGHNYAYCTVGGGVRNIASGDGATVAGGEMNLASDIYATVSGGLFNSAGDYSTVGGGTNNIALHGYSTVCGGVGNTADSFFTTIGGGYYNYAHGDGATVCGGSYNRVNASNSVIPGGYNNSVNGSYSFAFGNRVNVNQPYCAVFFKDEQGFRGRLGINIESPGYELDVNGDARIALAGNSTFIVDAANDKVGIGTAPSYLLDVNGDMHLSGAFWDGSATPSPGASGQILSSTAIGTQWIDQASISAMNDGDWIISGSDMHSGVAGNVGIGIVIPAYKLDVSGRLRVIGYASTSDNGVAHINNTGDGIAVSGICDNSDGNGTGGFFAGGGYGVEALVTPTGSVSNYYGVHAKVYPGTSLTGNNYAFYGISGSSSSSGGGGGGNINYGIYAEAVQGINAYGVQGVASGASSDPLYSTNAGVIGYAYDITGFHCVYNYGVMGTASSSANGTSNYGIYGVLASNNGIDDYAGYFDGPVKIYGSLAVGGAEPGLFGEIYKNVCHFIIDHPLDPLNKTLCYSSVESPENLCLYRGKTQLDTAGLAEVQMPDYFAALTKEDEATVTLTPIGAESHPWYEWNESFTAFVVHGNPNSKVSYLVLADRDDPVIRLHSHNVEEIKGEGNNYVPGRLLYPSAYGYPDSLGQDWELHQRTRETSSGSR